MRIGIIGCGGIAPLHLKVYKKLKDVEVVGLCDIDLKRAKDLAAKFNIEKTYTDYWDMYKKENLDMVDICTPVSTHTKIVCDATEAVPAILVEKPMALNTADCDKIVKEVEKHGSKLCIGHNQIFSPNVQKAKSIADSNEFNLFCFRTTQKESFETLKAFKLAPPWNVSPHHGGILWEVCCHLAYLQLYFLPDIKEVYALGSKVKYPVYDDFAVFLRTADERFGIIELSWLSHETETVYELRDTTGRRLQIHWEYNYLLENKADPPYSAGNVIKNMFSDQKRTLQKWYNFMSCYVSKGKTSATFNLINSYINSIRNDSQSPVSPEQGRSAVNLLECIKKSLDEKRPVTVT
jgi:predicted dehydrogenase